MLSIDTAFERPSSVEDDARRAVNEAVAAGARFVITQRDFLWESAPGANRSRIRKIIADAKAGSAAEWHAFVAAVHDHAGVA